MVAVTVILSGTVPWSAVGQPVGRVSGGGTDSRAAGAGKSSSRSLSLAAGVDSSRRARVVHYLQDTHKHTQTALQRTSPSRCRMRGLAGSEAVGYAGMSQMQTLVTRLGGGRGGYGWIDEIHFSAAPGAGSSQCRHGERTQEQEQAARSAGVRGPR